MKKKKPRAIKIGSTTFDLEGKVWGIIITAQPTGWLANALFAEMQNEKRISLGSKPAYWRKMGKYLLKCADYVESL